MMCKNRGIYGFLGPSWVLIDYIICPRVIVVITNTTVVASEHDDAAVWDGPDYCCRAACLWICLMISILV